MSDIEIKMKEISRQITELKMEHQNLYEEYIKELQEKLKPLIGMCFRDDNKMFRVIDVPQKCYSKTSLLFNKYQLPVLAIITVNDLKGDFGRLYIGTQFSNAADAEDPIKGIKEDYNEITLEEFDAELEKAFNEIRSLGKRGDAK